MPISNTDKFINGDELATEIESIKDDIDWHEETIAERKAENKVTEKFEEGLADLKALLAPLTELEDDIFFSLNDVVLISRDEFVDYCMRFAIDCGEISEDSSLIATVDWGTYADGIEMDYTSVYFDGEEFLYRS